MWQKVLTEILEMHKRDLYTDDWSVLKKCSKCGEDFCTLKPLLSQSMRTSRVKYVESLLPRKALYIGISRPEAICPAVNVDRFCVTLNWYKFTRSPIIMLSLKNVEGKI